MSKLNFSDKATFGLFLAGCLFVAGIPIFVGFFTPVWLHSLGASNARVLLWSPLLTIVFLVVFLVATEITDRLIAGIFGPPSRMSLKLLQALVGFCGFSALYALTMTTWQVAMASAFIASVLYLAFSPLVNCLEKSAPRE